MVVEDTGHNGIPLSSDVLVLNKHYAAIRVVKARRAFVLLYKNYAEVISKDNGRFSSYKFDDWVETSIDHNRTDHDEFIRTSHLKIKVPRVIRLVFYDKFRREALKLNRKNILARDANQCQYCGKKYPPAKLSIDHVIPRSRGGTLAWNNTVACCSRCNTRKGGRLPQEAGMALIKHPEVPEQDPLIHLKINEVKYQLWKDFITRTTTFSA